MTLDFLALVFAGAAIGYILVLTLWAIRDRRAARADAQLDTDLYRTKGGRAR